MVLPTPDEMRLILESNLLADYPEECVEIGENWEIIAVIFYTEGYKAASPGVKNADHTD